MVNFSNVTMFILSSPCFVVYSTKIALQEEWKGMQFSERIRKITISANLLILSVANGLTAHAVATIPLGVG